MRIIFMGSAALACPCLERIISADADVLAAVVTQPDRPKGRKLTVAPCPVRALVHGSEIPVLTPRNVNDDTSIREIRELRPELIAVVAYGQILKAPLLGIPPLGCINMHTSLLPKYRGAAPIEWAIARGETATGVTAMFMNEGMDTGDIIDGATAEIRADDTAATLGERLAPLAAELLARTLDRARCGSLDGTPQVESEATFAPKLAKLDGRLDWIKPATELHNRVRGFNPRPGCFFERAGGATVRVFKTRVETIESSGAAISPGVVLETSGPGPLIITGNGGLRLLEVQPEGRRIMSGSAFICGHGIRTGEQLPL